MRVQDGAATARRYDLELRAVKEGLEAEKRQLAADLDQAKAQIQTLLGRERECPAAAQTSLIHQLQVRRHSPIIARTLL